MTIYNSDNNKKIVVDDQELTEIFPFAIAAGPGPMRPILIFKDKQQTASVPVWLNALEAGIAAAQSNPKLPTATPHTIALKILDTFRVKVSRCILVEVQGVHQYADLILENHPSLTKLRVKAEEAISFCMHLKVPFFASRSFIEKSRTVNADILELEKGMFPDSKIDGVKKTTQYLM